MKFPVRCKGPGPHIYSFVIRKDKGGMKVLRDKIAGSIRYSPNNKNTYPWKYGEEYGFQTFITGIGSLLKYEYKSYISF